MLQTIKAFIITVCTLTYENAACVCVYTNNISVASLIDCILLCKLIIQMRMKLHVSALWSEIIRCDTSTYIIFVKITFTCVCPCIRPDAG